MDYLGLYNYWAVVVLMMAGFYIMIARHNLVKKLLGLSIFQTGIFYFYISLGKIDGGTAPIFVKGNEALVYSNPLPHVLILTAIVVGVATMAVGLALVVRIYEKYGTIEEDDIKKMDIEEYERDHHELQNIDPKNIDPKNRDPNNTNPHHNNQHQQE